MDRRTKIRVGDVEYEVREVDFEIVKEDWNEYRLLDGGRVKVRTNVARIFRVLDEEGKPAHTQDGDPHLVVRHKTEVIGIE